MNVPLAATTKTAIDQLLSTDVVAVSNPPKKFITTTTGGTTTGDYDMTDLLGAAHRLRLYLPDPITGAATSDQIRAIGSKQEKYFRKINNKYKNENADHGLPFNY